MFPTSPTILHDQTLDDINSGQLLRIMPRCDATTWLPFLVASMGRFGIVTPVRIVGYLAQIAHESDECRRLEENLNYRAERLVEMSQPGRAWAGRFPTLADAKPYAHAPQALANHVYASRMGNRGPGSGDGWKHRGSGLIQLTGHDNFKEASDALGIDFLANPELLRKPGEPAAMVAGWFWWRRGCNELADACGLDLDDVAIMDPLKALTRKVNGKTEGLKERLVYWRRGRDGYRQAA